MYANKTAAQLVNINHEDFMSDNVRKKRFINFIYAFVLCLRINKLSILASILFTGQYLLHLKVKV